MIVPEVVIIPEGPFLMGCEQEQENERPCHRVWLDGFGIGKFPITNAEYKQFLEATQRQLG
jgi:formylglycine-generating enzyme